ncbi:MAG: IS630 family transposase, partial [Anaerolineae bacterium]|nr:IS630 family transposase [Anaerolineae bacterium]
MPRKKYIVRLSEVERQELERLTKQGVLSARKYTRAHILLKADLDWKDEAIASVLNCGVATVERIRQRFVEGNLEKVLHDDPHPKQSAKLDGRGEAYLIALACSAAPAGHAQWSLRLLAEKLVALEVVSAISHEAVRQCLETNEIKPWRKKMWCIPQASAPFVAQMEAVLDVYEMRHDPLYPLVCFDETNKQLITEKRIAYPTQPGRTARYDYEYERHGTRNIFVGFAPLEGWRHLEVTQRRTKQDWAYCMRDLVDIHFPQAACIRVVLDNLNTHSIAALYETFVPAEAHRIARKLDLHFTPKHGSWLNMAEIELSVVSRLCLNRRIPDEHSLKTELKAFEDERNAKSSSVNWRFTTDDARIKLKHLY